MRKMLARPTAALFPLVGIAALLAGGGAEVAALYRSYYAMELTSLCAADCFRNAAAREPGVRRVDQRFGGALVQLALGALLLAGLEWAVDRRNFVMLIAVFCLLIEHMFEERAFALSRTLDGALLSGVSNLLLLAGLLIDAGGGLDAPTSGFYAACACALGAVVSATAGICLAPLKSRKSSGEAVSRRKRNGFSLRPANLPRAPLACAQTLAYPAALAALDVFMKLGLSEKNRVFASLVGLIPWRLARTVARRTRDESRHLNPLLVGLAALGAVASGFLPEFLPAAGALWLALVCAAAVFCTPGVRLYVGSALICAALAANILLTAPWTPALAAALALSALILNLPRRIQK